MELSIEKILSQSITKDSGNSKLLDPTTGILWINPVVLPTAKVSKTTKRKAQPILITTNPTHQICVSRSVLEQNGWVDPNTGDRLDPETIIYNSSLIADVQQYMKTTIHQIFIENKNQLPDRIKSALLNRTHEPWVKELDQLLNPSTSLSWSGLIEASSISSSPPHQPNVVIKQSMYGKERERPNKSAAEHHHHKKHHHSLKRSSILLPTQSGFMCSLHSHLMIKRREFPEGIKLTQAETKIKRRQATKCNLCQQEVEWVCSFESCRERFGLCGKHFQESVDEQKTIEELLSTIREKEKQFLTSLDDHPLKWETSYETSWVCSCSSSQGCLKGMHRACYGMYGNRFRCKKCSRIICDLDLLYYLQSPMKTEDATYKRLLESNTFQRKPQVVHLYDTIDESTINDYLKNITVDIKIPTMDLPRVLFPIQYSFSVNKPDPTPEEAERLVIDALNSLNDQNYVKAREYLINACCQDPTCISALLLLRVIEFTSPSLVQATDYDSEKLLELAIQTPSSSKERTKSFIAKLISDDSKQNAAALMLAGFFYTRILNEQETAEKFIQEAAKLKNVSAQTLMGTICLQKEDFKNAIDWFELAASCDDAAAQQNLFYCYTKGIGVEENSSTAEKWLRTAAKQGAKKALVQLGTKIYKQEGKMTGEALDFLLQAIQHGELSACVVIAECAKRQGDIPKAITFARRAAEHGIIKAQVLLSNLKSQNNELEESLRWKRKSALCNHQESAYELYQYYIKPDSYDPSLAFKWLLLAGKQNLAAAQYSLGEAFYKPLLELKQDYKQSLIWFLMGVKQGHVESHYAAGIQYRMELGVSKDFERAKELFLYAAKAGHSKAAKCLADMYYTSKGVERDINTAIDWYFQASKGFLQAFFSRTQEASVYVWNLPQSTIISDTKLTAQLETTFSNFGTIRKIKLQPTQRVAIITYAQTEEAQRACTCEPLKIINNKLWVRNSSQCKDRTIILDNLPENVSESTIALYFSGYGTVLQVYKVNLHHCFAFVVFDKHETAVIASNKSGDFQFEGKMISIELLETLPPATIIVSNLSKKCTIDHLISVFSKFGVINGKVIASDGATNKGVITYEHPEEAIYARVVMNTIELYHKRLCVEGHYHQHILTVLSPTSLSGDQNKELHALNNKYSGIVNIRSVGNGFILSGSFTDKVKAAEKQLLEILKTPINKNNVLSVTKLETIGKGKFGSVFKGTYQTHSVALKTVVLLDASNHNTNGITTDLDGLMREVSVLQLLHHPAIITYYGIGQINSEYFIVTELADGALSKLIAKYPEFPISTLVLIGSSIASGMSFLAKNNIVHCDLALRNILYNTKDHQFYVKISDFGLSRTKQQQIQEEENKSALPIWWYPPEVLEQVYPAYSEKTDVWSFGVLMWEILSNNGIPYEELRSQSNCAKGLLDFLNTGKRLTQPGKCPSELWKVIASCWHSISTARPSFVDLIEALKPFYSSDSLIIPTPKEQQPTVITENPPPLPTTSVGPVQQPIKPTINLGGQDTSDYVF